MIEDSDENSEDVTDNDHFKTWEELGTEIEARMRRDSEIEEFGEKVIEERSAAYPHQTILDGYISSQMTSENREDLIFQSWSCLSANRTLIFPIQLL